jgi:raffinose/stachyose/melibiose transport system permease protein
MIGSLKVFDAVFAMTKGGPGTSSETMMTLMIRTGFNVGRTAYACAFAVVFFIIVFTISRVVIFVLNRWEASIS